MVSPSTIELSASYHVDVDPTGTLTLALEGTLDSSTTGAIWKRIFHALSDSIRRKMLKTLASGDRRVTDLAKPHAVSLPAISKHVKVLERAGLVTRLRQGSEHYIQLRTPPLKQASKWIAFYQQFWSTQLEDLEQLLSRPKQ